MTPLTKFVVNSSYVMKAEVPVLHIKDLLVMLFYQLCL